MAKNTLRLDADGFDALIRRLESLGGNVKKAVADALGQAAETIAEDTKEAIASSNLPAGGKYSKGNTAKSIITDASVNWQGDVAWVPVGFDFNAQGAGGYLITGTPRMKPDAKLEQIYTRKKYMRQLQEDMQEVISDYITEKMGG